MTDLVDAAPISDFNVDNFWEFCASLQIDTKEFGPIRLTQDRITGTQRYFIEQVADGLKNGIHTFVVLKGRQVMITTITLALDLYWLFKYSGMSGSLVTHDEPTRDMIKATLSMYIDSLPKKFKVPIESHNRTQMIAKNRSRFNYQVAGTRKNSGLGRGKGLTFLHATEVAFWGDEEGIASLEASLAETHPNRFYVWETTAHGYNHFHDTWETAKHSSVQKAIFIGWWRNELYRCKKGSQIHTVYWDGKMYPEEKKWVREVKKLYDFDIDDEQIAWWRYKMNEVIKDDQLMYQEFPPTEDYAFVLSGSQFFNSTRLNDEQKKAKQLSNHTFRFALNDNFTDTEFLECGEKLASTRIWEFPKPNAFYVLGADPAYGSSEWADRFCISIWRCYADGLDQVAEFNTPDCSPYQFAWILMYLAGAYKNVMVNLEINGPGQAVWLEMQSMKRQASMITDDSWRGVLQVLMNMENYLYKRVDSFGAPSAYHWKTSYDSKERMLNYYKDCFERGTSVVASTGLLDEMKNVIRDDGSIGAPGRGKDDRVIAAALAHVAWCDFIRARMIASGVTRGVAHRLDTQNEGVQSNAVTNYLKKMGLRNAG